MTRPDDETIKTFERFAIALARRAGEIITPHFRSGLEAGDKSAQGEDFDPVTRADREAEEAMRELTGRIFPAHGIIGEEMVEKPAEGPFTWVFDPIDGTRAFIYGLPTWMTLAALLHEGEPLVGVAFQPLLGDCYLGSPLGAWRVDMNNGARSPLRTRQTSGLSAALAGTTLPEIYTTEREKRVLAAFGAQTRQLRFDADAYFYAMVAAGMIDIAFDTKMQPFDIAALIPIVRGAGGVVTDWDGNPGCMGGQVLAAANPQLLEAALSLTADGGS
jgi:myo-inositol-1(or 4)-monophosphatase